MAIDFDLHGLAGIRLVDATRRDRAAVEGQLGLAPSPVSVDPDIVIRFVDRLPLSSPLRTLGLDDAGFSDDAFLVLRGRHKSRARVQIPLDRAGRGCEIVCERPLLEVPLLIPILNLTLLGKGILPLHASAFSYGGAGWIATGWSKGGKTETLLAFMAEGATYVGDEWVYIRGDGNRMYGIPEPIRLWSWHLRSLPRYRGAVSRAARTRLRLLELLVRAAGRNSGARRTSTSRAARNLARLKPLLADRLGVDVPPWKLFGRDACRLSGTPRKVLLVVTHERPEVTVRPIAPAEIARRMVASLEHERRGFMECYWKFRFAFPERRNELVERARELESGILERVLRGKETYEVRHPYPVAIPALFAALRESCLEA